MFRDLLEFIFSCCTIKNVDRGVIQLSSISVQNKEEMCFQQANKQLYSQIEK